MSRISEESIERVAAANDIADVIGSYFPLKRAGSNFRALCPFHREKSPSFHVNPARQLFHCFGCGAGGGVFRFVMDYEHVDFPTAVRRLAQRAGMTLIETSDPYEESQREKRSRLIELHRKLALWYHHQLLKTEAGAAARAYLKQRGMTKEIAVAWQLGYAPGGWHTLEAWAKNEGFTLAELKEAGVVSVNESGEVYDRFRHRLMFPVRNDYGDVIGFSGRVLVEGDREAKYVNSPETLLFNKGKLLFGLDKSKRAMVEAKEVIVMEGQLDLISAFEHGFHNVVAPQGTAFTAEQARLLRRFVERVILCFDSDTAGKNAAERSLSALLTAGFEVRLATLPVGEDPDSLIRKKGIEAFSNVVREAGDFFDVMIERAFREGGGTLSPRATASLAKHLSGYLPLLSEEALRETTASKIATRLGISVEALMKAAPQAAPSEEESSYEVEEKPLKLSAGIELLCRLILTSPEVRAWLVEEGEDFSEEGDEELLLVKKLLEHASLLHEGSSLAVFLTQLPKSLQNLISSWDLERSIADPLNKAKDTWHGLRVSSWKRRQVAIIALLQKPGIKSEEMIKIQKEILDLQRLINEVL